MTAYLFAYGTLLPQAAPAQIREIARRLERIAAATIPGVLYDLGSYPGAVLDAAAGTRVHGEVLRVPDDSDVMASLDAYEGFDPSNPRGSLFVRTTVRAELSDGRLLDCWVYVYNRSPGSARLLRDGRYPHSRC